MYDGMTVWRSRVLPLHRIIKKNLAKLWTKTEKTHIDNVQNLRYVRFFLCWSCRMVHWPMKEKLFVPYVCVNAQRATIKLHEPQIRSQHVKQRKYSDKKKIILKYNCSKSKWRFCGSMLCRSLSGSSRSSDSFDCVAVRYNWAFGMHIEQ